ncbi:contactin-2 [Ixodes scapularis]
MSYVLVEFLLDKTQPVVSSDDVRDFSGVVEDDKVYQVYWAGDARTKGSFYDAKVLYMAVTAEGVQKFKVMPSDTQVNPGENMTLQCQVLNRRGDCVWLKDDQVIGNISGKYSFEMEPEDGDCTLQIVNATLEEDDASWRCQVTKATRKGSPLTSSAVNLVVREQPRLPYLKEVTGSLHLGDRFKTIAGDTRSFQCVSRKGNPPASLRWFLDSNDISDLANQTNYMDVKKPRTWKALSVLNYNFTEADNRKNLKCVAYHSGYEKTAQEPETEGLGHRDVAVTLDVMSRPNNIRVKPSTDSTFNASEVITLECMAQGNPAPEIRWFKQSEENSTVWNNLGQNAKLEISNASYSDKGVYRCEATNTIDNHSYLVRSKGIRIDIRGPPNLSIYPESGELQVKEGDPFEIGCTASGYPDPVISWRHRGNSSSEVNNLVQNNTLRIDSANQMHSGTYECTANNGYGDSVVRCVTVKVLGEFP